MAQGTPITITGNLAADPQTQTTRNGKTYANFTVVHSTRVRGADGQWTDGTPTFFKCKAWGRDAQHLAASARKGTRVILTGTIAEESYDNQQGERKRYMLVNVDEIGVSLRYATAIPQKDESRQWAARDAQSDPYGEGRF